MRKISMISDSFDSRTLANMEVALERACKALVGGEEHTAARCQQNSQMREETRSDAEQPDRCWACSRDRTIGDARGLALRSRPPLFASCGGLYSLRYPGPVTALAFEHVEGSLGRRVRHAGREPRLLAAFHAGRG
jgi:hypothetical protein